MKNSIQNQNFTYIHLFTTKMNIFPEKEVAYVFVMISLYSSVKGTNTYINEPGYFLDNIAIVSSLREHALPD